MNEANAAALSEWEELGVLSSGQLKPKPNCPDRVDPRGYQKANVLASFPNLIEATKHYQLETPDAPQIIGGDELG